jgi:hypothetical protein
LTSLLKSFKRMVLGKKKEKEDVRSV